MNTITDPYGLKRADAAQTHKQKIHHNTQRAHMMLHGLYVSWGHSRELPQKILNILEQRESMTVKEIYCTLRIEQSEASRQLSALRKLGVVRSRKRGQYRVYSIDYVRVEKVFSAIKELAQ